MPPGRTFRPHGLVNVSMSTTARDFAGTKQCTQNLPIDSWDQRRSVTVIMTAEGLIDNRLSSLVSRTAPRTRGPSADVWATETQPRVAELLGGAETKLSHCCSLNRWLTLLATSRRVVLWQPDFPGETFGFPEVILVLKLFGLRGRGGGGFEGRPRFLRPNPQRCCAAWSKCQIE